MNDESPPKGAPDTDITNQHDTRPLRQTAGAALAYAQRGWHVFPTHSIAAGRCTCRRDCDSPAKHPVTQNGLHDATTNLDRIAHWWRRFPWANVAVATGQRSGIFVLDVDDTAGLKHLDELPETLIARTGSGGLHYVFQHPGDVELRNRARVVPGIDIRGDGGYIVAPPSRHISGRSYEWVDDRGLVPAPEWLVELVRAKKISSAPPIPPMRYVGADVGTNYGLAVLDAELRTLQGAAEGVRNHSLFLAACNVFEVAKGGQLDAEAARRMLERAALSTGLSGTEIRRTIESAWSRTEPRRPRSEYRIGAGGVGR